MRARRSTAMHGTRVGAKALTPDRHAFGTNSGSTALHGTRVSAFGTNSGSTEKGAAIITALLVVALAAILVSGILWRQEVQIRRIENQRLMTQAQWVARGALDWTRLILRSEADTSAGITYLGGVWAVPIERTRLSEFLGQSDKGAEQQSAQTYLSGSIEDAQAKFNLRNLVSIPAPGLLQVNVQQVQAFQRLLSMLGLDGELAKKAALQMRASLRQSATRFQANTLNSMGMAAGLQPGQLAGAVGGNSTDEPGLADSDDNANANAAPLQMTSVDSLLNVPGFTPEMVTRLRPFVTVLPTPTPANMNTASPEVVAAVVPGMSLSSAQAFVSRRETVFFRNIGDVQLALTASGVPAGLVDASLMDVTTSYFLIHGRVQYERAELDRTTLVYRDTLTHATRIVRVSDKL